jgi:[ribosomal protein S5]-alanine N-acetyltransferase
MTIELETQRLDLIPVQEKDWDLLAEILNDISVRQYLLDGRIVTENEINLMILSSQISFQEKKYGLWFIVEKNNKEIVGFVGLWHFFEEKQPQLSYALLPRQTKCGFATEAAAAIVEYSFSELGFQYLTASCDRLNLASQKVLRRLNFYKFKEEIKNGMPLFFYKLEKYWIIKVY